MAAAHRNPRRAEFRSECAGHSMGGSMRHGPLAIAVALLAGLAAARIAGAQCSTNCLLVNDATDTTHGSCDFGRAGTCSLRDAFTKSNAIQGWSIQFAIATGHQTINVQ